MPPCDCARFRADPRRVTWYCPQHGVCRRPAVTSVLAPALGLAVLGVVTVGGSVLLRSPLPLAAFLVVAGLFFLRVHHRRRKSGDAARAEHERLKTG